MDSQELKSLVETGEGQNLEFKRKARNISKELVAFANTSGGTLLIGVDDSGDIIGVDDMNKEKARVQNSARNCDPPVELEEETVGDVLAVHIEESSNAHRAPEGFYTRQGAVSQKLSREEIMSLMKAKGDITFGKNIAHNFSYPEDFDEEVFEDFLKRASITDNISREQLLSNLGVAEKSGKELKFTNAGVLMFAENPKKFFIQAEIICTAFESRERVDIHDRKVIEEPLIPSLIEAVEFTKENLDTRIVIESLTREEKPEIPEPAFREAVVNAIMHRDYTDRRESIHIDIFPEKVEVRSPGGLVEGMRPEDLGEKSMRRNPVIADLLDRSGFVERSGTGINRMKMAMKQEGLPEPDFETNNHFKVSLKTKESYELDLEDADLNERQKKALKYISRKGNITNREYRNLNDVKSRTALRDLKEMVEEGLLDKKGSKKNAVYSLSDKNVG